MRPVIEFGECVRDSPRFRSQLDDQLQRVDNLDGRLERLLKASAGMMEHGKTYVNSQQ
jgi:Arf-GAP/coiled-coil/ANK repeat/PH domain-containing protein